MSSTAPCAAGSPMPALGGHSGAVSIPSCHQHPWQCINHMLAAWRYITLHRQHHSHRHQLSDASLHAVCHCSAAGSSASCCWKHSSISSPIWSMLVPACSSFDVQLGTRMLWSGATPQCPSTLLIITLMGLFSSDHCRQPIQRHRCIGYRYIHVVNTLLHDRPKYAVLYFYKYAWIPLKENIHICGQYPG